MFCGARPLGPWGGVKRSNIILFQLQSQFQRFLYQSLCVFSQIKDIKHIKQDFLFCSLCLAPELGLGGCWGLRGAPGGSIFFPKHSHVAYKIEGDD